MAGLSLYIPHIIDLLFTFFWSDWDYSFTIENQFISGKFFNKDNCVGRKHSAYEVVVTNEYMEHQSKLIEVLHFLEDHSGVAIPFELFEALEL